MNSLIEKLTKNFADRIPDDENEKKNLIESFKLNLQKRIEIIKNIDSKYISKDFESIRELVQIEADRLLQMDIESAKRFLLEDKKFEEIQKISRRAFELAAKKLIENKNVGEWQSENEINTMKELLVGVKSHNQKMAENLISEAILDFMFLDGTNAGFYSLRLFYLKKQKAINKDREEL